MLTEKEMNEIAERYISVMGERSGIPLVIGYGFTIKKEYGNVYFYDSKKHVETGAFEDAIGGNAPFLVENKTGKIVEFGTGRTTEYYIQEYEAGRWGF